MCSYDFSRSFSLTDGNNLTVLCSLAPFASAVTDKITRGMSIPVAIGDDTTIGYDSDVEDKVLTAGTKTQGKNLNGGP